MVLVASKDFSGLVNGENVRLAKGDRFTGSKRNAETLRNIGFLEPQKRVKKGETNEC